MLNVTGKGSAKRVGLRMKLANNTEIKPVRFPNDYNDSIFNENHHDYNNIVAMSFSSPKESEAMEPLVNVENGLILPNDESEEENGDESEEEVDESSSFTIDSESSSESSSSFSENETDSDDSIALESQDVSLKRSMSLSS
jgi:hypothetical protein